MCCYIIIRAEIRLPSADDRLITGRIAQAGALVGIDLLDHIIIGNHCYMSFREEGLLENA